MCTYLAGTITIHSRTPLAILYHKAAKRGKMERPKRIAKLSQEQKDKIADMATPTAMPRDERKRQYAALRRAVVRSCEPALLAKFSLSSDGERWEG